MAFFIKKRVWFYVLKIIILDKELSLQINIKSLAEKDDYNITA